MPYPYQPYQPYQPTYPYAPPMQDQLGQLRANQFQQPVNQPQMQAQSPASSLKLYDFVQGEAGAKGYLVAAGNTVLLLDSESERFYLKSTDASGVPMPLRVFDYTERTAAPKTASAAVQNPGEEYVTRREFEAVVASLRREEAEDVAQAKLSGKKTPKNKEEEQ